MSGRAKLSFGSTPANPDDYLPKTKSLPSERYTLTEEGALVDESTGEEITDPGQKQRIVTGILEHRMQENRVLRGRLIATKIVAEDFTHLSDVPMNSRASISRAELLNALVKAAVAALKESGR